MILIKKCPLSQTSSPASNCACQLSTSSLYPRVKTDFSSNVKTPEMSV